MESVSLKIIVTEEAKTELSRNDDPPIMQLKFVVLYSDVNREKIIATIFPPRERHVKHASNESAFVGAGSLGVFPFMEEVSASWGSMTCVDKFGRDQPPNIKTADSVLEEVRLAVEDFWKSFRK